MTEEYQIFVAEPMRDKPVTALPGIDETLGTRLKEAGFHKARDVLGQYLVEEDQQQFERWLKDTCGADEKQFEDCYQALSEWYGKWGGEKGNWRIAFWNVRGLLNKDEMFWKEIEKWDVIVLMETFLEEKNWERISNMLPTGYKWKKQETTRIFRAGRASGGMMIGVREEMVEDDEEEEREEAQGILTEKIKVGAETWTVVGVCVNGDIETKLEILRRWINEQGEERKMIIGGDFCARTGNIGGGVGRRRRSKDEKVDTDGIKLTRVLREAGWEILNGDEKGTRKGSLRTSMER